MIEHPQPSSPQTENIFNNHERLVCRYDELETETRTLLEGVTYRQLPEFITLDKRLSGFFSSIRAAVDLDREKRKINPLKAEMIRRARLAFSEVDEEDSHRHLQHLNAFDEEPVEELEHGQRLYLDEGKVIQGRIYRGDGSFVAAQTQADNIEDDKAIVDIHNHPHTSPPSRQDIASMVADDKPESDRCLYFIAAQELNIVVVICQDSQRYPITELRTKLKLGLKAKEEYFEELEVANDLIPKEIENKKQVTFIKWFADIIKLSHEYQIGIYFSLAEEKSNVLKRADDVQEIIELSHRLSKY
ncbi:MAG TPA: hypothetical protein VD999_03580 [Vitreimonas sp.]|nr:hypothetical protein [Vitreimonas sp.]